MKKKCHISQPHLSDHLPDHARCPSCLYLAKYVILSRQVTRQCVSVLQLVSQIYIVEQPCISSDVASQHTWALCVLALGPTGQPEIWPQAHTGLFLLPEYQAGQRFVYKINFITHVICKNNIVEKHFGFICSAGVKSSNSKKKKMEKLSQSFLGQLIIFNGIGDKHTSQQTILKNIPKLKRSCSFLVLGCFSKLSKLAKKMVMALKWY